MIKDTILQQVIQAIAETVWKRPELEGLREPIEQSLQAKSFRQLSQRAFQELEKRSELPDFLSDAYISHPITQRYLAEYIVKGNAEAIPELASLYARQFGGDVTTIQTHLGIYLKQLRESLASDTSYGPILMARDVQVVVAGIQNLASDMGEVKDLLRELISEPEIQALVERKQGRHIFLSYTRANLGIATRIRNALEDAGHTIWQDVTAIKGGIEWIQSIEDGIDRAYAVVTVVSHTSQESEWVTIEFLHASRRNKQIVPIKVDDAEIPTMMLTRNVVHGHPDLEDGIQKLLGALPSVDSANSLSSESTTSPIVDRRQLEIDYLDRILLEHSVWQTVYTPMAGVGQMRIEQEGDEDWEVASVGMAQVFDAFWQEESAYEAKHYETKKESYDNILDALAQMKQLILLGEPGSGKSTSLWRIAADSAQKAKANNSAPLPLVLRLGELKAGQSLAEMIESTLGYLAPFYADLLAENHLMFLLDGLNEMPSEHREQHAQDIKTLVEQSQENNTLIVISCRRLDYSGVLDMGIPEQVEIAPLDPLRIRQFVNAYISKPEGKGDELFWELAGDVAQDFWQQFIKAVELDNSQKDKYFWLQHEALEKAKRGWSKERNYYWSRWLKERDHPRSMLSLSRNPFMLFMITQVFTREKKLPENRGTLFERFVDFLLEKRESLDKESAKALKEGLAELGYKMQREGEGTSFSIEQVSNHLSEKQLYMAKSANLLTGQEKIRFSHQLLQEYHAAKRLDHEMQNKIPASHFFPPENWWEASGWEETAILLAGLYSKDTSPVIEWLRDAQPELTARCILESGAYTPNETIQALESRWQKRLTDLAEPILARAAIRRAMGLLDLDTRPYISVKDGLPDIDWVNIPDDGEWTYQASQHAGLGGYDISRYPITYAQFQCFVDAEDGLHSKTHDWFEGLSADESDKQMREQEYKYSNHPRETVNWYQAMAFCRWLSWQLNPGRFDMMNVETWAVRLPNEFEWEKAARGTDGREYPYEGDFDASKGNTSETGIGKTSAVGIFPQGASPYGVLDMSGNVWEWCLSEYSKPAEHLSQENIGSNSFRVLRGGSWFNYYYIARAASRARYVPDGSYSDLGCRVVRPPSL